MIVSGDGPGGDLGYPSTVQLADGSLLTAWYELMRGAPRAVLRQSRWSLEG
jgi:sialidase-1